MPSSVSSSAVDPHTGLATVADAVCTACGCTCDDIGLSIDGRTIVEARRACNLGRAWFFEPRTADEPLCTIDGRPATLEAGLERAAQILVAARYPLVYGLTETTVEAQRAAAGLADRIGGVVDTPSSRLGPTGVMFRGVGEVGSTLGEIRNRSTLLVYWGVDPARTHPRHFTKHALTPAGRFVPGGRKERYAVLVDVRRSASADACDEFLALRPDAHFDALWTLRALLKGVPLDEAEVERTTGVALAAWHALADRMRQARYGALIYGEGLTESNDGRPAVEAVAALVHDLNAHTRFVARALRGRGNPAGADNVLTWRTGFPFAVDLSHGYPQFGPGEYTADAVLRRGEADAALLVAGEPAAELSRAALERLQAIPTITLGDREPAIGRTPTVAFRTATPGLDAGGTVYRTDDVPLALRPAYDSSRPSDAEVLARLGERIAALEAAAPRDGSTAPV